MSLHGGHFEDHPQRHQEHTEQAQAPPQNVGPAGVHVGLVELQGLVLQHGEDEGALGHITTSVRGRGPGCQGGSGGVKGTG